MVKADDKKRRSRRRREEGAILVRGATKTKRKEPRRTFPPIVVFSQRKECRVLDWSAKGIGIVWPEKELPTKDFGVGSLIWLNVVIPNNSREVMDVRGQVRSISPGEDDFRLGVHFMDVPQGFYDKMISWDDKAYQLWINELNKAKSDQKTQAEGTQQVQISQTQAKRANAS